MRAAPPFLLFLCWLSAIACGGNPDAPTDGSSRCKTYDDGAIECSYRSIAVHTGVGHLNPRNVNFQLPLGEPPEGGWPTVILFQGSFTPASLFYWGYDGMPWGGHYQVLMVRELLDNGIAVLAPDAHLWGALYWDSNLWLYSPRWEWAEDNYFMEDIFRAMEVGAFGELDMGRMFAAGISSGGYMASRMAVEYPERFDAIAVAAASYAWCYSSVCDVPELDAAHPPTLFLHGDNDRIVPVETMKRYADALEDAGVEHKKIITEGLGHGWIPETPHAVLDWFGTRL